MNVPEIDLDGARRLLDEEAATFVDIRDPASYEEAHVPGAVHVDNSSLPRFLADTDRSTRLIVYCYHGNNSLGGTAFFREQGFGQVESMSGGFEAWRLSHPFENGKPRS